MTSINKPFDYKRGAALTAAPAVEPVTLSEAKDWLRIDGSAEDSKITLLIKTARQLVEKHTGRLLITQTHTLTFDSFIDSAGNFLNQNYNSATLFYTFSKHLPLEWYYSPIQSITSLKTYSTDNTESTLTNLAYTLHPETLRLALNDSYDWPTELRDVSSIKLTAVYGYGDTADNVPAALRQAILMTASDLYNQCCDGGLNSACKQLVNGYKRNILGGW